MAAVLPVWIHQMDKWVPTSAVVGFLPGAEGAT